MDDKLSIRVNVAERYYPLRIDRSDEERIRLAARMINDKVSQYQQHYADKDMQDFLAMASLQMVIKLLELENQQDETPLMEAMKNLDKKLDELLAQE
ncbi:cell division protein ZapA [Breznakibacter xylanolyticus]|uniref:Cell division protein ZapA n=1 Tax=Breznakibacter xylanolyticus TaxID=990 RepID=A0A2W7NIK6_9BACT|nr:cell division protein ZapA [Breznakibacter xylanolyticus]MBN2743652.1 cell division protein ZapA [Marinilabiliaceae bacterium]PZX20281.1 cell division protein ZapA [Breznakibacter xylanolyticus]